MITIYIDAAFEGNGRDVDFHMACAWDGRSSGCGAVDDKGLSTSRSHVSKHSKDSGVVSKHFACVSSGVNEEMNTYDADHHVEYHLTLVPRPMLDVEPLARNGEKGGPNGESASLKPENGTTMVPEGGAVYNVALDCVLRMA